MRLADSPRAVAATVDVVFMMVSDSAAVQSVAGSGSDDGLLAGLSPGTIVVDMSTISPEVSRDVAARVRERGADMVDAPVSGSVATIEANKLAIMVGGAPETIEKVRPLLLDLGPTVTPIGGNGQAVAMKIAVNISVGVQIQAFAEGMVLAEKSGIDRKVAMQVLTNSAVASPLIQYRGPMVMGLPDEPWFNVNMMQKDMMLALDVGRRLAVPLATSAATNECLSAARAAGLGEEDFASLYHLLAKISGVTA
jgi:3-hydroxyisobutyrate dehydrogenase-like beta-hydroxyacid dehydrogenase